MVDATDLKSVRANSSVWVRIPSSAPSEKRFYEGKLLKLGRSISCAGSRIKTHGLTIFPELGFAVSVEVSEKCKYPLEWQCASRPVARTESVPTSFTPAWSWRKHGVAIITGLLFFVSSETILAVKRPPYPIKAEEPDAGHWVIIGTNEDTR